MANDGYIMDTPESIALYRLIHLKSALKLESKGLRMRNVNARKLAKQETGLKTNDYTVLIDAVEALIVKGGENPEARFKRF